MQLRDVQEETLEAIGTEWSRGCRRQLAVLATGVGKTVIVANLPRIGFERVLLIAHREELLDQGAAKLLAWNPRMTVSVDQAERCGYLGDGLPLDGHGLAVCASVATIGKKGGTRLRRYRPDMFDVVVIDEAHHSTAKSYRNVIEHMHAGQADGPLLLGVTATPGRGDGQDLSSVFDRIVYSFDLVAAIQRGYLVDVRAIAVATTTELDGVAATREDFVAGQLEAAINTGGRNARVVKAYVEQAAGRKAIVFCGGVQHSKDLAEAFAGQGVNAWHVDGKTPNRGDIFGAFSAAPAGVLCNVDVATEGYDEPSVNCVILARPFKSGTLVAQCVGRGTRLHPGKADLLVIDMADVTTRHTLAGIGSLFGLPPAMDLEGTSATAARKRVRELVQEGLPFEEVAKAKRLSDLDRIRNEYREVSLFWKPQRAAAVQGKSDLCWVQVDEQTISLRVAQQRAEITTDLLGHATLKVWRQGEKTALGIWTPDQVLHVAECAGIEEALQEAEDRVTAGQPKAFVDPGARWRKDPASDKQLALLRRLGVPHHSGLTKGEAGLLIDTAMARRSAARRTA